MKNLQKELKAMLDWLDHNYAGESNEERASGYLEATERITD